MSVAPRNAEPEIRPELVRRGYVSAMAVFLQRTGEPPEPCPEPVDDLDLEPCLTSSTF